MIVAYYQPEKPKSRLVMEAFAQGCGARMVSVHSRKLAPGAAAFYGVRPPWVHLWHQALAEKRETFYLDNSWFDVARERFFRVGRNAVQSWTSTPSDGERLHALGVKVKPWRSSGAHIVVTPQTHEFMATVAGDPDWLDRTQGLIRTNTDRSVLIRTKGERRPLAKDLEGAWLLVAHSSAAAVEALLAGVPVIATDTGCAAAAFSSTFPMIESPNLPEGREAWAAQLADSQWTIDELKNGDAMKGWA